MLVSKIIQKFNTWVDDGTELSDSDELDLFNKVYKDIWTAYSWEFSKKSFSGFLTGTTIALPSDFAYIAENAKYTDISSKNYIEDQAPKLVWVGNSYYRLINYSDRKQYENREGYCYVDIVNDNLVFTTSVSGTVEYDYVYFPEDLTLTDSPAFPEAYQPALYHLMASDDYIIQQFDKAKSYSQENEQKAINYIDKMKIWNANLLAN